MSRNSTYQEDSKFSSKLKDWLNLDVNVGYVLEYIQQNFYPWDIFEDDELDEWAEKNGYVKETE